MGNLIIRVTLIVNLRETMALIANSRKARVLRGSAASVGADLALVPVDALKGLAEQQARDLGYAEYQLVGEGGLNGE